MHRSRIKPVMALVILLALTGLQTAAAAATPVEDPRTPELPSPLCDRVRVPEGNNLQSRMYATGVQVYKWDGASWVLVEPIASLFGCSPDTTASPWLLLETVSTTGPGIFSSVTYIQRLNTSGGLAPAGPGSAIGELVQVPYTAEYFFYREQ
jgi:hypothetical protein